MLIEHQAQDYLALPKNKEPMILSALDGIDQGFGDKEFYPTICDKAIHLLRSIESSQAFPDGNKRVALAVFEMFLYMNKSQVTNISQTKKEKFVLSIANNIITKENSVKCCVKALKN